MVFVGVVKETLIKEYNMSDKTPFSVNGYAEALRQEKETLIVKKTQLLEDLGKIEVQLTLINRVLDSVPIPRTPISFEKTQATL